jgi:hypothetical protein
MNKQEEGKVKIINKLGGGERKMKKRKREKKNRSGSKQCKI